VWRDTARRDEPAVLVQFIYLHHRLKWPSNIVLLTLGGCIGVMNFFSTARVRSTPRLDCWNLALESRQRYPFERRALAGTSVDGAGREDGRR
jgi:hypothetical protein